MTHAAPAKAAPRAIDIASAVNESLTHSQIVKVESQSAPLPHWHFQETETGPLDAVAHGANHFTGNASHRERQDEEEADNNERQRAGSQQVIFPIELHHERAAVSAIPWRRTLQRLPQCYSRRVHR
jgi:hypothetical protein